MAPDPTACQRSAAGKAKQNKKAKNRQKTRNIAKREQEAKDATRRALGRCRSGAYCFYIVCGIQIPTKLHNRSA